MRLFDARKLRQARRYAQQNSPAIERQLAKLGDTVDRRTGGKHTSRIRSVQDGARRVLGSGGRSPR